MSRSLGRLWPNRPAIRRSSPRCDPDDPLRRTTEAGPIPHADVPGSLPSMATITQVHGVDGLRELIGKTIGPSDWREVTQEMIDSFAEISGDDQWIHVDAERAKTESPFGTTIAHGNLTLSMIDGFRKSLMESTGFKLGVNYEGLPT